MRHPRSLLTLMLAVATLAGCGRQMANAEDSSSAPAAKQGAMPMSDTPMSDASMKSDMPTSGTAEAVFAGGCFWCVEGVFEQLEGVIDVTSGYAGGSASTANYEAVCTGTTGHAESVRIRYDPKQIGYEKLLEIHFHTHDPTSLNRQGNDVGTQYRSAIFYANDEQKREAAAYIKKLTDEKVFPRPIVTTLEPLKGFYPAETYHQDYACKNPYAPYIQAIAMPKIEKTRKLYKDLIKPNPQP